MRCRTCDYPLWNLVGDICPECGTHYKPSEFKFVPGSVKYLCPNCEQQYYGTSTEGHLRPPAFECVQCGEQVEMNSMRLQPADGWEEELTVAATAPWSNPSYGFLRRWISTIGWAHVKPAAFMKGLPLDKKVGSAWVFFVVLQFICAFMSISPGFIFMIVMVFNTSGQATMRGPGVGYMFFVGIGWLVGWLGIYMLFAVLWALLTHATLKVTGGCAYSFGRTCSSILFSSGTLVMTAVPCLGLYCLGFVGMIWWVVSATLMVTAAQRVSGLRASFATIWPPGVLIVLVIASYVYVVFSAVTTAGMAVGGPMVAMGANPASSVALSSLANSLRHVHPANTSPSDTEYLWPESIFDLDLSDSVSRLQLAQVITGGDLMDEVVPSVDGYDFSGLSGEQLDAILEELKASSIRGDGFERIGGLVYCLPGSLARDDSADGEVFDRWLLVTVEESFDGVSYDLIVRTSNGTSRVFSTENVILSALAREDKARAEQGLPSISQAIVDAIELVTSKRLELRE